MASSEGGMSRLCWIRLVDPCSTVGDTTGKERERDHARDSTIIPKSHERHIIDTNGVLVTM